MRVPGLGPVAGKQLGWDPNPGRQMTDPMPLTSPRYCLSDTGQVQEEAREWTLHTLFAKTGVPRLSSLTHTMHTASYSYPKSG